MAPPNTTPITMDECLEGFTKNLRLLETPGQAEHRKAEYARLVDAWASAMQALAIQSLTDHLLPLFLPSTMGQTFNDATRSWTPPPEPLENLADRLRDEGYLPKATPTVIHEPGTVSFTRDGNDVVVVERDERDQQSNLPPEAE
jgi:hypothetical protein